MSAPRSRLASIDVLRGIAALSVLILHARGLMWVGASVVWSRDRLHAGIDGWIGYLSLPFRFGHAGVMLFFVLSGFCIHRAHVAALAERRALDLRQFAFRRVRRIYPTLLAALALTAVADALTRARIAVDAPLTGDSFGAFLINLTTLQNILGPTFGTNGPLWSLSVEEHIYIAYPLLYWLSMRIGVVRVWYMTNAIGIATAMLSARFSIFLDFLPYWGVWTTGMLAAEWESGRVRAPRLPYLAIAFVASGVGVTLHAREHLLACDLVYSIPFGLLVAWSTRESSRRFFGSRPMRVLSFVGLISYSLYATHYPILLLYRAYVQGGKPWWYFSSVVPACLTCALVAWVVFQAVERRTIAAPKRTVTAQAPSS